MSERKPDIGRPVPQHGSGPAGYNGWQWVVSAPHPAICAHARLLTITSATTGYPSAQTVCLDCGAKISPAGAS